MTDIPGILTPHHQLVIESFLLFARHLLQLIVCARSLTSTAFQSYLAMAITSAFAVALYCSSRVLLVSHCILWTRTGKVGTQEVASLLLPRSSEEEAAGINIDDASLLPRSQGSQRAQRLPHTNAYRCYVIATTLPTTIAEHSVLFLFKHHFLLNEIFQVKFGR